MANYAYLRVSTNIQDVENQKLGVLDYCNNRNIASLKIIEDTASGKVPWYDRKIGKILKQAKSKDCVVVSEVSRLGRSTLQVLEILEFAAKKEVAIHIAKSNMVMDGSMQTTITATILGLAAQIEREFISSRTKEALERCRADGVSLGRPKGQSQYLKLDAYRDEIIEYLRKGINKRSIAKLIECSPSTLYSWLKRRRLNYK